MSNLTISNLPRITTIQLRQYLLNPSTSPSFTVIDVRDSDYIGGHILGSKHVPTGSHPTALPELARTLQDKDLVVFHCMLCQQRGPKAALEYARTRERLLGSDKGKCQNADGGEGQKVAFLEGGFAAWQQAGYGVDEKLTEGYNKQLWDEEMLD